MLYDEVMWDLRYLLICWEMDKLPSFHASHGAFKINYTLEGWNFGEKTKNELD